MNSAAANRESARQDAKKIFDTVGVSRIVMVDDEYAPNVEDLLGICDVLGAVLAELPHLGGVDPDDPEEERNDAIRDVWTSLDNAERWRVLATARESYAALPAATMDSEAEANAGQETDDHKAASSLEDILRGLENLEFVPLCLGEWMERRDGYLGDGKAAETLLLFDRDFSREQAGTENEGLRQIQTVQSGKVGYCGLLSHTVPLGKEYEAWKSLSDEHGLDRDKFVVIAKDRLKREPPDYYGFLGMLRLTALSSRYGRVKSKAWSIFESSLAAAKSAMESLSVLDFDRIVFASSRDESVWEPDTLLRVFGILMRRVARSSLHEDEEILAAVGTARRVSDAPDRIGSALTEDGDSSEALEMQRFEIYDAGDELNRFRTPIDLGDIFRIDGKLCMLLAQPCDLVVRKDGKRNYETNRLRRVAAVAELVRGEDTKRDNWGRLPFYEEETGKSAFVNFGKVHQLPLVVLDLCAISEDGSAAIELRADAPEGLIEPWRVRYGKLRKLFSKALTTHTELMGKELNEETASLVFPGSLNTLDLGAAANGKTVRYDVRRTIRLCQPWSGALLTEFAQYHARAAFEHEFGHRDDGGAAGA